MHDGEMAPEAKQLLQLILQRDRQAADRLVRALVSGGVDPAMLVEQLLAPLQRRIGTLWEQHLLDRAAEMRSSAFVENALEEIAPAPSYGGRRHTRPVLVACPPGEWHTLPARMVATLLRLDGWNAIALGAAPSIENLMAATSARPLAVLLSCTMPTTLFSASHAIEALHAGGVPVIVGGAGFGLHAGRGRAVGADAWAATAAEASHVLGVWEREPPQVSLGIARVRNPGTDATACITDSAIRTVDRFSARPGDPGWTGLAAHDLVRVLELAHIAVQTGDETILSNDLTWWRRYLDAHTGGADDAALVLGALADASPPGPIRTLLLRNVAPGGDEPPAPGSRRSPSSF